MGPSEAEGFRDHGDLSSSLEGFEASIARLRKVEARRYGTSYQVGVVDDQQTFPDVLDRSAAVIHRR